MLFRSAKNQLANQIHHAIETFGFHANGGIFFSGFRLFVLFVQRLVEGAFGNGLRLQQNFPQGSLGFRLMLLRRERVEYLLF